MDADSAPTLHSSGDQRTIDDGPGHDPSTNAALSYHQERLWFVDRFETGHVYESSPTYHNIPLVLLLDGRVDHTRLEHALNVVLDRHAVLRTNIVLRDEVPVQTIRRSSVLRLPALERLGENNTSWMTWVAATAARPFRLDTDLLIRADILEIGEDASALQLTLHHIVADRQSLRIIAEDIARAYTALCRGDVPAPTPVAVEYAEYAEWQRDLTPEQLEPLLFYWKWQLRPPLPVLRLPECRPRPAVHTYTAASHRFAVPEALALRIRELAASRGTSVTSALLAAFTALLHRYSNQDDIIVGVFAPCRKQPGTEDLVGPLANLLPIRTRVTGDLPFASMWSHVSNAYEATSDHQELPFERLVLELNPDKDMSRTALFDVVFHCDEQDAGAFRMGPLTARLVDTNLGWGKYDLNLAVHSEGDGLSATLMYNADIYDATLADQMMGHYVALLEAVVEEPGQRIGDVTLLSAQELHEQVVTFNSTDAAYRVDATLHQLFEEQVVRTPEHIALVFGHTRLTYAELDRRANRLAHYLRRRGAEPETLVAVSLDRSADLPIALLAVLKAGAAYLPVDPDHPRERRQFIVDDAGARLLITTASLQQDGGLDVPSVVRLDHDGDDIAACSDLPPANRTLPHHLAYCIYTSGSTGQPKGALVEHRHVVRLIANDKMQFAFSDADVWTLFHSAAFDFSVWEMYGALLYGGTLVVVPKAVTRDPSLFITLLLDEHVTVLNQTPSAFLSLAEALLQQNAPALSLRYVIFGGESLHPRDLRDWRDRYPAVRLINMYGITETTVHVTFKEITEAEIETNLSNVGVPIPTTTVYVLDERLRLVPAGVPGEIYVGGAGVCRGYLAREELTTARFVANPYRPGETLYRSGDLGRRLANGELIHLGRIDDQVQIRGFRVELGEIHRHLIEHPAVAHAEVVARHADSHQQELIAYVVPSGDPSASTLRQHLTQHLPDYMIPAAFVFLKALPLTPNGKVDRGALPEPERTRSAIEAEYAAPRTTTEDLMRGLWERTLARADIGVHDNFFELGGHSLLATQLFARIRDTFGVELPLRLLFEHPTIAGLSEQLDAAAHGAAMVAAPAIARVPRTGPLPLSFAQQRLWLLHEIDPGDTAYNVPVLFRVTGPLDVSALRHSIAEILGRHESLRTAFRVHDHTPVQVVSDTVADPVREVDLRGTTIDEAEARALAIAREDAWRPFDLGSPPLLRVTMIHLADADCLLAVTMHHIVSDGWSMEVLVREATTLYRQFLEGMQGRLPVLPSQYGDFAVWQREWLRGDVLNDLVRYWKDRLSGAPATIALPFDAPPALQHAVRAGTQSVSVDARTTTRLREIGRDCGTTLFMTLLTAFAVLLHRYSGQEDLAIGTPIANRRRTETQSAIGFFVNTLVLRTDLSGRPTFRELLHRVRQIALDAYAHQDLPFEQVVEALHPDRSLSRTPLFQVMFSLQHAHRDQLDLPNVTVTPLPLETRSAKFDLTMVLAESGPDLVGALEYNADCFSADTARRMVEHFQIVLAAVTADPLLPIAVVPLCHEDERRHLLRLGADSATDYPRATTVQLAFEEQARTSPDAIALAFGDEELTYREVNERANQLAHFLQPLVAHPLGPHRLIGICMEQSAAQIVGLLAILKTGCGYVPLDPDMPDERMATILADAGVAAVLTQERLLNQLTTWTLGRAGQETPIVCVDREGEVIAVQQVENPVARAVASDLAYVIYTSGSTGTPKGVAVAHRSILRLVRNTNYVELVAADRMAQVSNASFDAATFEVWGALLNGARLVGIDRQTLLSPPRFAEALRARGVTVLFLTTALFNEMARQVPDAFGCLRCLLFGGEAVTPKWVRQVLHNGGPQRLLHVYGPTENTTFSTWHPIEAVPEGAATLPVGRGISNTQTYVLDDRFQPVPPGIAGELYLAGDGLAREYLGRPELTAAAFLPNPWTTEPGERLYRTGDIVRTRADGAIEFVGRRDHQIKIRGFRVEPGEIEAALEAHPRVRAATVVSQPDGDLNPLVAYVVPEIGGGVKAPAIDGDLAATLLEALSDRLPAYMVPGAIVVLDAFPLNANGKVDRGRLPRPVRRTATTSVPARTPTEELLCGLWSDVLDLSDVGVNDDFYERGGHSLLATQLASRIRETFEIELPLWRLFESATPAALAPHVDAQRDAAAISGPLLGPAPRGVARQMSFAQERLWFLDQLVPGDPFYNVALAIRLTGQLDAGALERSLQLIVRRHEALRTTFATIDGRPVPQVRDELSIALTIVELLGIARGEQEQEIQRLAAEEARRPFLLARGPLLRTSLVVLAPDAHVLLLTMHHIVSDGWSLGVLLREVSTVYVQITNGAPVSLPDLPLQYADFAYWQREWFQGDVLETQLAYWKRQLAGAPQLLRLPTDRPRPRRESFRGSSEETSVDTELADDLRRLSRRSGTTLFMTLLSAFAALLQRYSGQEDFVIGTPVANRTRRETEDLIGFFVNTLALRFDGSGNPTFSDVLARVRTAALDAYDHQDLPFERLVDELGAERDLSRNPLFQVMFALQNAPMRLPAVAGLEMASLSTKRVAAQFDLVLDVWETPAGLTMVWEYNADLFDGDTIRRMASHFHSTLRAVANTPELRIAELPLLSADEQRQLVALGRGPDIVYPSDRCLQDLFEAQVRTSPHRVAAVHGPDTVTYAALNEAANRVAHWLRRRGVGPNQFVAILEERGIDFLAAMLGVLKAGAAFLPIDPRYPPDRIRYMLADSQVQTLITREAHCDLVFDAITDDFHLRSILLLDDRPLRARHGVADVDDRLALQREERTDPPRTTSSVDLAYMLYTSGSTGLPKGALVRHDGAVNHIFAQRQALKLHSDTAFLQSAPSSSDISVWQFLAPLLIGGRTVIADYETVCDPASLFAAIRSQGITLIELVPVVLQSLIDYVDDLGAAERTLPALQCAMVTGEIVQPSVVSRWFAEYPEIPLVNAYGPTEAADDICQAVLTGPLDPERSNVPIGRPLANLSLFVLDPSLNLVVPGALGEICVAGVGVGAGYWRREAQTQASFVQNPFAVDTRDAVIYRTGDLGRWRPDGLLELTGRIDDQVKINGFRIELGEVETVLTQHPSVQQAAVVVQHDDAGEKRLVAHVVPARTGDWSDDRRHQAQQVATWEMLHDKDYGQAVETPDPTRNTIGWESTYTGQPIPDEEMREYVDRTIERILALRPRKVLEIGCGTGLLAFRLIPRCEEYWGTDLSAVAIARLTKLRGLLPPDKPVTLLHREAADFSGIPEDFDVVVINSVTQYFPTGAYLGRTLEQAIRSVRAGGAVFVGDVRDLRLLHAYHASVQTYKADATLPIRQLRRRVQRQIAQEQELLVHPDFFVALQQQCPRLSHVRIEPKRGRFHNELTRFRFDVTLEVDAPTAPTALPPMDSWNERLDIGAIRRRLGEDLPNALGYRAVPNARVQADSYLSNQLRDETAFQVAGALAQAAADRAGIGLDPEDLWTLARDLGYAVEIGCSPEDPATFDVLFRRDDATTHADDAQRRLTFAPRRQATPDSARAGLTSRPLQEKLTRGFTSELLGHLKSKLPKHMIPAQFVLTEVLPLTPAGKVNRSALPAADLVAAPRGAGDPPRTDVEKALVEIWREVLGVEDIGVNDNFFDLGGHSLKATQVVSRLAGTLDVEIPLRELFNHPTIGELAAAVESHAVVRYRPIERVPDAEHYPVSHAQSRLWVLAQFDAASRAYNMPAALLFDGPLDRGAFESAVAGLVQRHESLRTTFTLVDGELRQRIAPAVASPIISLDLSGEPSPEERARELAQADATAVFDLETGPLFRIHLLRLAATRHVVLFNMHHIVSDDRSMQVLIRDFVELYGERGEMAAPPARSVQYRDYAVWQQRMLREHEAAIRDRRYWHDKLAGPPVLNLRTDFRRPIEKTYNGASVSCNLGPAATAALKRLCQHHGATLFMTLVAAVKTLLFRYTGQNDIIIGSPVEGRTHRDLEHQVGFFINMLALRDRVDDRMPFVELLHRVRDSVTAALDHQNCPFDALVHDLKLDHDVSRSPLFDVVVVLQNPDVQRFTLPDVAISPFGEEIQLSKFDLAFNFEERAEGLALVLVYNPDLFLADTVERLRAHLETLIASVLIDPICPVGRMNLLPAAEREQIVSYSAPAPEPRGPSSTMVERFEAQVKRAPDAVALTDGTRHVTYAALNAMANQCAHYLRSRGVGRNVLVGIGMERSIDMIAGLLGILKAGGAYVPLDLGYPKERLAFIVEDANLPVVLTDASHAQLFTSSIATLVDVGADAASISAQSNTDPKIPISPSDLAYVIYTSGSTGRPKGVLVTHANVTRLFTATDPWFHFGDADVWSFFHSYAFDFSVWEIWGALLHGARLVIVPYLTSRSPDAFYDLVRREQVTILSQTPLAFRHFAHVEPAMSADEDLRLRLVVLGGEALDAPSLHPWFERHPHRPQVINMYGITETTVHVTYRPIGAADTERPASMVGCPIPDLSLYILDAHLQPVPFGVAGELYVGGEGVARGYLNRPALTAERFIPDPFSTQPGARLYKSGDLGCYHANGDVEYLGRADDQVKIRGFRIELGEMASVLSEHEGVRECAVIAHAGDGDDKRLIAYVVPATEPAPDATDLRAFLHERLPDYMIPHGFIVLTGMTSLPLTPNGKLDRRAVPGPDATAGAVVASDAQPRTELERAIAEVWRDVLKADAVGIHVNFFDLGGDSIAIIKTRDALERRLHIDVPLTTLFRLPTISALADDLSQGRQAETGTAADAKTRARQQIEGRQRRPRRPTR